MANAATRTAHALRAAAGAAFGAVTRAARTAGQGLTLVPAYLSGLLWLLSQTFEDLARKGYAGNSAVYAVIRVLCRAIPEPPLIPYQMKPDGTLGDPLPWDHPLRTLIRRPNELMSEPRMWEMVTLHVAIVGRSVWFKERNNAGDVIALWPLRPDRVGPIYSTAHDPGQQVISGWSYLVPGTVEYIPLARADTFFYLSPDPAGDSGGLVEGLGALQTLAPEVSADNEATKYVGALLSNYGTPGVVISTKTPIPNADAAKLIKASFMREFGGARRGSPALIDADASFTQLGFNLKDLEFPALRATTESRIASAYGVPAILAGLNTGIQSGIRATISEQRELFAETTCTAHWRTNEATFSNDVATEWGDNIVCLFDTTKVKALQEQGKYETERIESGFKEGAVSIDEYRTKVLQLPPVGGDFGASFNVPVASAITPTPDQPVDLSPSDSDDVNDDPRLHVLPTRRPPAVATPATPSMRHLVVPAKATKAAPVGATANHVTATNANAVRRRQTALDHHSGPLLEYLHALGATMAEQVARHATVKHVYIQDTAPPAGEAVKLRTLLEQVWLDNLQGAFEDASDTLGTALPFDVTPDVRDALDGIAERAAGIDETTAQAVRKAVDAANAAGETPAQLGQRIRALDVFRGGRAVTIGQTESATAYNTGTALAYRQSGMVDAVQVSDGDHDAPCAEANGAIWSLDDAAANPLQHPRCFPSGTMVEAPNLTASFTRWFEGELVVLRTAANDLLSCTPNHPILTDHGWVAAGALRQGDHVIRCLDRERVVRLLNPDYHDMPTAIEQIADALGPARGGTSASVPASPVAFHGDGAGSDIYVVRTNRLGEHRGQTAFAQQGRQSAVVHADAALRGFASNGHRALFVETDRPPTDGGMGSIGVVAADLGIKSRVAESVCLTATAHQAEIAQPLADSGTVRSTNAAGNLSGTQSLGDIHREQGLLAGILDRPSWSAHDESVALEMAKERRVSDADEPGEIATRFAGLIAPVEIVEVNRRKFSGHVYNLETVQGWYIAQGIITHNCIRSFAPVVTSKSALEAA
jgi:HK97 family phage portal protein